MEAKGKGPKILITGTPGTGKTSLSEALGRRNCMQVLDLSRTIREEGLYDEYDDDLDCTIFNEDKVTQRVDEFFVETEWEGGCLVDFHSCDFFEESAFDIVAVLRTDNSVLYDRLKARDYTDKKITQNIECEIFQVLKDEAEDLFGAKKVVELRNDQIDDFEKNVSTISDCIAAWKAFAKNI